MANKVGLTVKEKDVFDTIRVLVKGKKSVTLDLIASVCKFKHRSLADYYVRQLVEKKWIRRESITNRFIILWTK